MAVAAITALSLIAAAGLSLAAYTAWLFHDMPDARELVDYRPPTASRVYAWDGTLIGEFSKERRIYVPYEQMPTQLAQAFLAAEDRNFFRHGGVDAQGFVRAMWNNVGNVLRGRRLEGGSTITQQVAKNILLNNDITLGRKVKEAILSARLEQSLTKERILELYLNEIWLGYRSYGVAAAAYNYFGKSINDLSVQEMAYLAAVPKGPDNYHPIRRKGQAIARRNWVIQQMMQQGWVTPSQGRAAMAADLVVQPAPARSQYREADYFVEEVRRQGMDALPRLEEGGYYIRTTLDKDLQRAAREALMSGLERYDRRHGWRGAFDKVDPDASDWRETALNKTIPTERTNWRAALVTESSGGTVRIRTAKDDQTGTLAGEDVTWARAGRGLSAGDLVFVERTTNGAWRLRQIPAVNGALVAIEPYSGRVVAMVGGYSFSLSKFNRATQAWRQPGSAFKPLVYAAALENGFTPASMVTDEMVSYRGADGQMWTPENYDREFYGTLPIRKGIERSINGMTVRIAQQVGMRKISDLAIKFGAVNKMEPVLAMALGAGETTPLRLTGSYATFVNGGRKITPHLMELVQDGQGRAVLKADSRDCQGCRAAFNGEESPRLAAIGEQIIDPVTAYQMTSFMQGTVQRGTAASASSLGYPLGGKTGTTNEYRSAWFVGFSADLVVGVFVGRDDNLTLGNGETGSQTALPIFIDFMRTALKDQPKVEFKPPKTARFVMVNGIMEAFRPGTERAVAAPVDPLLLDLPPGALPGSPSPGPSQAPPPAAQAPPPPRPQDDLFGLY